MLYTVDDDQLEARLAALRKRTPGEGAKAKKRQASSSSSPSSSSSSSSEAPAGEPGTHNSHSMQLEVIAQLLGTSAAAYMALMLCSLPEEAEHLASSVVMQIRI